MPNGPTDVRAPILITGGAGFIGHHIAVRLLEAQESVVVVDHLSASYGTSLPSKRWRLLHDMESPSLTMIEGDLRDPHTWQDIEQASASGYRHAFHLAAWPGVRQGEREPENCVSCNLGTLTQLIGWASRLGSPRIVFFSSSSVYGDSGSAGATAEDDAREGNQMSLYAACKFHSERVLVEYSRRAHVPISIVRPFTVIGPLGRPDMAYASFARQILRGEPLTIFGDLESTRDFTSVRDLVDLVQRLIDLPEHEVPKVINAGFGRPRSLRDLVSAVSQSLGAANVALDFTTRPATDPLSTHSNARLLESLLPQQAPQTLEEMVSIALMDPSWTLEGTAN